MLLITEIKPRTDGTVIATSLDGKRKFIFAANAQGELSCEVDDEPLLKQLLRSENFFPANESDYDAAIKLSGVSAAPRQLGTGDDVGEGDDDGDDDIDADEGDPNGAPVEAGTAPAGASRGTRRARAQRA